MACSWSYCQVDELTELQGHELELLNMTKLEKKRLVALTNAYLAGERPPPSSLSMLKNQQRDERSAAASQAQQPSPHVSSKGVAMYEAQRNVR